MEPEVLVFMPKGDVTLTLVRNVYEDSEEPRTKSIQPRKKRLSIVQQTPIDENKQLELEDRELEDLLEDDESMLFYAPDAPNASDGPSRPPSRRVFRGSDASSRRDRSSSPPASFWAQLKRQQAARDEVAVVEDEPESEVVPEKKERKVISSHEVHCIVSSRHMMLASEVFETLLKGDTAAAKALRANGHVKIQVLADFDTLVILLTIIHGPSRKVPRQVTLYELSNLAVLVSKFGMIESVQFFSDTWIDALQREGLPKRYNDDVLRLLFVFWVFDRPDEFKNMTRLAQRECDENLFQDAKDIPIPQDILDAIKREREYGIETAITIMHTLISRYMEGNTICDASLDEDLQYACDAIILGSLMKSARKIEIWPRPESPFTGRKFRDLARAIRGIRIVDVCNRSSRRAATLGSASNGHGLEDEINASMKDIEAGMDGLELLQYVKKSEDHNSTLQMFVLVPETIEEVTPPPTEDGKRDSQSFTELETIPESPKAPIKTILEDFSPAESRSQTPINYHQTTESHVEEQVKPILEPHTVEASQNSRRKEPQGDSRTSSRASDYQVREPYIQPTREEPSPTVLRSPSQNWMNPERVNAKPPVESYSIREQDVKVANEELNVFGDREAEITTPLAQVLESDEVRLGTRSLANGIYPGNGTTSRNKESTSEKLSNYQEDGHVQPRARQVQELAQNHRQAEIATPKEGFVHLARRVPQTEITSKPERLPYSGSAVFAARKSPTEERSPFENVSRSERNSYAEPSNSFAVKKPPTPPEAPYPKPQRSSYSSSQSSERPPAQLTQTEKLSHAVSQLEAARAYIERNATTKQVSEPDLPVYQPQRPPLSERRISPTQIHSQSTQSSSFPSRQPQESSQAHRLSQNARQSPPTPAERVQYSDQQSYTSSKSSPQDISQPPRSTLIQRQSPPAQVERSTYENQSSYIASRPPQQDTSQPTRQSQNDRQSHPSQNDRSSYGAQASYGTARPSRQEIPQTQVQSQQKQQQIPPIVNNSRSPQPDHVQPLRQYQQPSQATHAAGMVSNKDISQPQSRSSQTMYPQSAKPQQNESFAQIQQQRPLQPTPQSSYTSTRSTQNGVDERQQPRQFHPQVQTQTPQPTPPPGNPQSQHYKPTSPLSLQSKPIPPPVAQQPRQSSPQRNGQHTSSQIASASERRDTALEKPSESITDHEKEVERESPDAEDSFSINQPQKFNMRKSKKKFSTRF